MSAIGGVFLRTNGSIEPEMIARLSADLAVMGPDEEALAFAPGVTMIHRAFWTNRHAGPGLFKRADGWIIALDGRIDNVPELTSRLRGRIRPEISSAELMMACYEAWGEDAWREVIGDFALALWDATAQRLVLGCDVFGRRPLYYHETPHVVMWSSRCLALATAARLPTAFDEECIADFLAGQASAHAPIRGIRTLPAAHVLEASRSQCNVRQYWTFNPQKEIRYKSDDDYEQHFREVFEEAVRCRLDADGPVYCELSGGIDSSSIYGVADRLMRTGRARTPDLVGVSYLFDGSADSDERSYMQPVVARAGRPCVEISETRFPLLAPIPSGLKADRPTDEICFIARQDHLTQLMQARDARVLLSGIGGDQMFWASPPSALPLADLLARRQFGKLLRSGREWSRLLRWPLARTLWVGGCWPALPRRWQARTERATPRGQWYTQGFLKRTDFVTRAWLAADDLGFSPPSRSWHYSSIRRAMRLDVAEWCSSIGYLDVRLPFLDRRVAEFGLAIPLDQMVRMKETRSIVRRALRDDLPEIIRTRLSKAGPSQAFLHALIREAAQLESILEEPRVAAQGWVDRDAFALAVKHARHGVIDNIGELSATISLELWLRSIEATPSPLSPQVSVGEAAPPSRRWMDQKFTPHEGGTHVTSQHELPAS